MKISLFIVLLFSCSKPIPVIDIYEYVANKLIKVKNPVVVCGFGGNVKD